MEVPSPTEPFMDSKEIVEPVLIIVSTKSAGAATPPNLLSNFVIIIKVPLAGGGVGVFGGAAMTTGAICGAVGGTTGGGTTGSA